MHLKPTFAVVFAFILATSTLTEAKRSWSSSSSKSKSRPTSYSRPSSSGTSNHEYTKLSYGSNYNSQPKPASNPSPIGWNVPSNNKPQGPPPAYSASNPAGGAKVNPYEKPPAYNPAYSPASSSNTNYRPGTATGTAAAAGTAHHGTAYRPKQNSTGGFGGGYGHRNSTGGFGGIQQSHVSNQHSSYPTQQGANYHPSGGYPGAPAGATYYPAGGLPAGATYHPAGGLPAGATYHPAGGLPAGATYHPAGGMPAGASYYPSGYHPGAGGYAPAAMPAGGSFIPAGGQLPQGATFFNNPSQLPPGASYYPPKSSGPGLGTGLIAGALGGAILGHALTPTHTQTVQQVPVAGAAPSGDDKDRIIIINNGQPATVTESKDGTTIINTNPAAPAQPGVAQPPVVQPQPGMPPVVQPQPGVAPATQPGSDIGMAPLAPMLPVPTNTNGTEGAAPLAPFAPGTPNTEPQAASQEQGPPPGGIICVPVMVNVTSPTDPANVTQVEQIACYPAPPPEQPPMTNGNVPPSPGMENQTPPASPNMNVEQEKVSTASLPENSKLQKNSAGCLQNLIPTTFLALILAYCFQN